MKSSQKSIIFYRKGKPSKSGCAWFNNIGEAINYDGDTDDEEIYYLVIYPNEYDNFRENGVGFVLKESCRDMWECLESRVKPAPPCLVRLLQQ